MNSPKNTEKTEVETRLAVFIMALILGSFLYIDSAVAGGTAATLKHQKTTGAVQKTGPCPQPRKTKNAPAHRIKADIPANADAKAGKVLFQKTAKPMACKMCHGKQGAGNGKLGKALTPRPRNFTCSHTMKQVSPGQMFWVIKNGSKGSGMIAHGKTLTDKQIWDIVKYIDTQFVKR